MKRQYLSKEHTTSVTGAKLSHVTITHPHHPLNGQKLELVGVLRGPNSRLVVKKPDGSRAYLPRDWTDYSCHGESCEWVEVTHLLPVEGLRELLKIIDQAERETLKNLGTADHQ
jgi:hypothetical protein